MPALPVGYSRLAVASRTNPVNFYGKSLQFMFGGMAAFQKETQVRIINFPEGIVNCFFGVVYWRAPHQQEGPKGGPYNSNNYFCNYYIYNHCFRHPHFNGSMIPRLCIKYLALQKMFSSQLPN